MALPKLLPIARSIRDVRRRHRRVARAIVELTHECLQRHPDGSFEAFTAREALRIYLPETLAAYLALPRALRRIRRAGRPSADDELSRQLRTLHSGLERIREADAEIGATRMAENGAFLTERFASPASFRSSEGRSMFTRFRQDSRDRSSPDLKRTTRGDMTLVGHGGEGLSRLQLHAARNAGLNA